MTLSSIAACARRSALDDFRRGGAIECAFESRIVTWLDQNGDGQRGDDEPALGNVALVVRNATADRDYPVRSDSTGSATFFLMFAGCGQKYVVNALPPEGFELTTRVEQVTDYVLHVTFGFVRRDA